jgi:hypothetical protein
MGRASPELRKPFPPPSIGTIQYSNSEPRDSLNSPTGIPHGSGQIHFLD